MPARYCTADIFALPSKGVHETWGLAVNEAMHMGVPCLVSDRVGCQQDLVQPGSTGWVCTADSPQSLVDRLRSALTIASADLRAMGIAATGRVTGYSYEEATKGLLHALYHSVAL